ncbi:MAG: class I SAM-dependent methyltransferase [Calothrix sp. C42_A2020_038]|nr:class I SAM-dependent methyltransferase [Calothrix sp. C42_A2020_038]
MTEPRGKELIELYRANYAIAQDAKLTEEMILQHWELEKHLTHELLESKPESRWETFEKCYSTLYRELDWLNRLIDSNEKEENLDVKYAHWIELIGSVPKKVYEIGSGKGKLITYLATQGYECRATEITRERGEKWVNCISNLTWSNSDGIHFEHFEPINTYDVAISDQVVEHLHPDDLVEHFRGVLQILVSGGRYIFMTPHVHAGPSDISRVFRCEKAMGMHLKEYTYRELAIKLKQAGFKFVRTKMPNSKKIERILGNFYKSNLSHTIYLNYLCLIESLIQCLPNQEMRQKALGKVGHSFKFSQQIVMIAEKK